MQLPEPIAFAELLERHVGWWHQLQASKHEVLLAVDLYNRASPGAQP